ncbi:lycopene cyclase family protein [Rubrobacter tropicus]|nr:lycopene cyclase family protein [Rubrobacter tropicus]
MSVREYDVVFVGGGLAASLLLKELRKELPGRVAVVDPSPLPTQPSVHWSYWSHERTPYDRFAIGAWQRAKVGDMPPESIAPYTMSLVRSGDVFADLAARLESAPVDWLRTSARSIGSRDDGMYEVSTDAGVLRACWVFDSACDIGPAFPTPHRPGAVLNGTGIRVTSDRPAFDAATATLFDPLDERSFAYLLPLGPDEALLESATFGPVAEKTDAAPLLRYLMDRYPGASFVAPHEESGSIPLGFPPLRTAGPRHVLLGTKRGLVKPSAGYGIVRIVKESEELARLWREHRPLAPSRRDSRPWALLDTGFLQLVGKDPRLPLALLGNVMRAVPLARSLGFIDEQLPPRQLASIFLSALPIVLQSAVRK